MRSQNYIDFNIQGLLGIRLINPSSDDMSTLAGMLGSPRSGNNRNPDIVIRYERDLSVDKLTFLGLNTCGYTGEGFYVLDRKNGKVRARIPFEKIGNPIEILCQSGSGLVPLFWDIIKFTLLKKNHIAIHASAFQYKQNGVLVMGWSKGGKTEALLAFANRGATYVGDECVFVSGDGQQMFGIPFPVTIWDWQLKYISNLLPNTSMQKQIFFKGIHIIDTLHRTLYRPKFKKRFLLKLLDDALPALRRQLKLTERPQTIFGNGSISQLRSKPDKLFLMMGHSDPNTYVEPCNPTEMACRMHQSNAYEQIPFIEYYRAFKFAFPDLRNDFLEYAGDLQRTLLNQAISSKEAYKVLHPYPVSLNELFLRMRPFCG